MVSFSPATRVSEKFTLPGKQACFFNIDGTATVGDFHENSPRRQFVEIKDEGLGTASDSLPIKPKFITLQKKPPRIPREAFHCCHEFSAYNFRLNLCFFHSFAAHNGDAGQADAQKQHASRLGDR